jgi:hypothetical protein
MTTIEPRPTTRPKRAKSSTSAKGVNSKPAVRSSSPDTAATKAGTGDPPDIARVIKHDRVLLLLSRKDGATIPDMMEATGWQQHCFADDLSVDALSQKRPSGGPSFTRSPRQSTMSAARGASTVTNAGGWGACSPLRSLKLNG